MVQILHTLGGLFCPVGPLTVANGFLNPSFESVTGSTPDDWQAVGRATLTSNTSQVHGGGKSCLVSISSGTLTASGLSQTITTNIEAGNTYNVSAYFYIPATLPAPLNVAFNYYDVNNNLILQDVEHLTFGAATQGWTRISYSCTVPDQTEGMTISILVNSTVTTSFILDDAMWSLQDDYGFYVDGTMAGYVWADQPNGITLQSATPETLIAFNNGSQTPTQIPAVS